MGAETQTMTREAVAATPSEADKKPVGDELLSDRVAAQDEMRVPGTKDKIFNRVEMYRGEMIPGTATGRNVEFANWWDNRRQRGGELTVGIEPETVRKDFIFVGNYAATMGGSRDIEAILVAPDYRMDKLLMDRVTDQVLDSSTGLPIRRMVNPDKLYDFLQTSDGIKVAMMLMEDESLLLKMGAGMAAEIRHQFTRGQKEQTPSGKTVLDRNSIPTIPGLAKTGIRETALALISAGYLTVGTGKSKLDFRSDDELLAAVKNHTTPEQVAYLRERTGGILDLDAIQVTVVGGVPEITYSEGYNPDLDTIKLRITNADHLRQENLEQLGFDKPARLGGLIKRSKQIRFPEEFLFNEGDRWHGTRHGRTWPEDLPVGYSNEIMTRYRELLVAGAPDRYTRLHFMIQARREVMVRYLDRGLAELRKTEGQDQTEEVIKSLKEKQRLIKEDAAKFREAERIKFAEEKKKAEEKKIEAEQKKTYLIGGPEGLEARRQAVVDLVGQLSGSEFGVEMSDDFEKAIKMRKKDLQDAIADMDDPAKRYQTLLKYQRRDLADARQRVIDGFKDAAAAVSAKATVQLPDPAASITAAQTAIVEGYADTIGPLKAKYDKLTQQLAALEAKEKEYLQATRVERGAVQNIRGKEPERIQNAQKAIDTFLVAVPPAAALLGSPNDVRNATVDQLIALQTTGTDEEKLQIALRAKATEEAKRTAPLPQYQTDALTLLTTIDPLYTSDYVLRLDYDEIYTLILHHHVPPPVGAVYTPSTDEQARARREARAAMKGASRLMGSLAEAEANQEIAYYDGQAKDAQKKIDGLGDVKEKEAEIDAALIILENATSLGTQNTLSRVYAIADDPQRLADLSDTTPINAADAAFSQAERDLAEERWMYEWYRLLCPQYMIDSQRRDELFNALTNILPPNNLKAFLYMHHYGNEGYHLQQSTQELLNYVRQYAMAI